jgi:hypothetical protein
MRISHCAAGYSQTFASRAHHANVLLAPAAP